MPYLIFLSQMSGKFTVNISIYVIKGVGVVSQVWVDCPKFSGFFVGGLSKMGHWEGIFVVGYGRTGGW